MNIALLLPTWLYNESKDQLSKFILTMQNLIIALQIYVKYPYVFLGG
jgi:hypothetical protein